MREKGIKLSAAVLCFTLIFTLPSLAAEEPLWTRSEGDGGYVTLRVPYEGAEALSWSERSSLCVRYADDKQPVPLTGEYLTGALYATVPAADAGRPLEVFSGEVFHFKDTITVWQGREYYDVPQGADALYLRGVIKGDGAGNLNADAVISRAEAFTLIARLLSLEPGGDPGYADVTPEDWFYDAASAARAAGIAAADVTFNPSRPVTRGEFTVMLWRAMKAVGWLGDAEGTASDLDFVDAGAIPDWALDAYLAFAPHHLDIHTDRKTGQVDPSDGGFLYEPLAEQDKGATRGEIMEFVYGALRALPVYPTQTAIQWGFDKVVPIVDGSTSTYPYTQAVYGALFRNYENQPQFPRAHSKSYHSYERLINGEADVLFISTKPTQATLDKAKAAGVELELTPISYDAMVFFTNPQNSVTGLTSAQIRKIYVDNAYTNWKELGGPDAAFIPYCRNMDSGSQAQMEEFFLKGDEIHPDIRRETTAVSMASVLTDVEGAYRADPPAYALGYSIFYYYRAASQILLGEDGLKLLAVDGVMPTDATIADGSYPLSGYNYAVVRADEPEDSPARRMVDFMLSEEGQQCVGNAGFGPLQTAP